jgi:alpha-galactosidase
MGSENFILDGGWNHAPLARRHTGDGKETDAYKPWIEYRGDWYSPPGRFPSGVDKFALHVRRLGMRFGFWCEPQVSEGTPD